MNTQHRFLTKKEEEKVLIQIMDILLDDSIPYSGAHRKQQWEKGWRENLKSGDTTPKYFGKYKVNRLNGKFVIGKSKDYEQTMLYSIVDKLGKKYLADKQMIVEHGCGTGHNLWRMKAINSKAILWGLDWTRSAVELVKQQGFMSCEFDFFNPIGLIKNGWKNRGVGVYTVASLEQTGTNYKKYVRELLKAKPDVVVHIEPIPELLDPTNLLDYLSIKYMTKRRYLTGYLDYLRDLEKKGKIKILEARRSGIGSFLIDGYSVVVWKPL